MRRISIVLVLGLLVIGWSSVALSATVSGRVAGPDGEPAHATVRVLDDPDDRLAVPRVLRTEDDGRFEFEIQDASARIRFESSGRVPVVLERIDPGQTLAIRFETGFTLVGRVLDSKSGEPLPDATLRVCDREATPFGFDACAEHTADVHGRFSITGVPDERVALAASASGRALAGKIVRPGPAANDFHLFELDRGWEINGRVVDDRGQPVAGARIGRNPHDLAFTEALVFETPLGGAIDAEFQPALITDDNGDFRHPGVAGRDRSIFWGIAEGWFGVPSAWVNPETHASETLELRLVPPATLRFGLGLEGESIQEEVSLLRRVSRRISETLNAKLGDDGRYVFEGLPGRELKLLLEIDGHLPIDLGQLSLAPGETTDLGDLPVIAGATITGTVTDGSGPALDASPVQVDFGHPERFYETAEVEEGAFVLRGVPLNVEVRLWAGGPGYETFDETITLEGDIQKEIVLVPHARLTGRVLTDDDEPVRQFRIVSEESFRLSRLEHGGQDGPRSYVEVNTTAEDGSFTISPLKPGPLSITIEADGWVPASVPDLVIEEHRSTDMGDMVLERGQSLSGTTRRPNGGPAEGSLIWLAERTDSTSGTPSEGKRSDRDGRYRITGLQPGYYRVYAQHPDYAPLSREMQFAEDVADETLDIDLVAGGAVSGTATDRGGSTVPGVKIQIACPGLFAVRVTTTGPLGGYRLDRLPEETCHIGASLKYREPFGAKKYVVIDPERESRVDFDLSRSIEVTGTILVGGEPAGSGQVIFVPTAEVFNVEAGIAAVVDSATGRYRIEVNEPGEYRARVISGGGRQDFMLTLADEPFVRRDFDIAFNRIRGQVVDGEGLPVSGAEVRSRTDDQSFLATIQHVENTNSQGRFELRHLDPGIYEISVFREGYRLAHSGSIHVTSETMIDDLKIVLQEATEQIRGRVIDPSGSPIDNAMVLAAPVGANRIDLSVYTQVEPDGSFVLDSPGDGPLDMTAISQGWSASRRSGVTGRDEITFQLGFGGSIAATVVDGSGAPKAGLALLLEAEPPWLGSQMLQLFYSSFVSGPDGIGVAERLPAGTYRVSVAGGSSGVARVVEGGRAEVKLRVD